jgi:mannobiose 2-epimerase
MNDLNNSKRAEAEWKALPAELETELDRILLYWQELTPDTVHNGFYGRIDQSNTVIKQAPRGAVLNARILWTFSAAYNYLKRPVYLDLAERAYSWLRSHLTDQEFGGLFWSTDWLGNPLEPRKQVYAQAFGIYGMSEYYKASGDLRALDDALSLYEFIEKYSRDHQHGGYTDAFSRDWSYLNDKRLSAKDENAPKTMNTHLHILEAYTNLYAVNPVEKLRRDIQELLQIFNERIINRKSQHLGLFFSEDWIADDRIISFGHDIEAGWLLQACAESIEDAGLTEVARKNALGITEAAMEGLDEDGGLWYEYNQETKKRISEKHWWPQAEALIGFCNAWQLTGSMRYKNALLKNWHFIQKHIIDNSGGEWFWGVDQSNNKMPEQDKVGIWKCPYHNTRACLELLKRLKTICNAVN